MLTPEQIRNATVDDVLTWIRIDAECSLAHGQPCVTCASSICHSFDALHEKINSIKSATGRAKMILKLLKEDHIRDSWDEKRFWQEDDLHREEKEWHG